MFRPGIQIGLIKQVLAVPNAYDRLMEASARGGLKALRGVQQTAVETMILSLANVALESHSSAVLRGGDAHKA